MTGSDRPPLTRDRIFTEAVRYVDRHGLEALSMRRLGAAVGVEAMSLYNHVADKDDLLRGISASVFGQIPLPGRSLAWRAQVTRIAEGLRDAALDHPKAFPLLARRSVRAAGLSDTAARLHEILTEAGLDEDQASGAVRALLAFVLGFLSSEILGADSTEAAPGEPGSLVARTNDRENERDFELGVGLICAGVQSNLAGRLDG